MTIYDTNCCGLKEIDGLQDYGNYATIRRVLSYENENQKTPPFYLFTGVTRWKYGQELAKYIVEKKLGKCVKTPSKLNPNSMNKITAWIWVVNRANLDKLK
jgi:hypothetical protein